jgi:hypothetical protein
MKLLHVALCAGAVSACAIDDGEKLDTTTQAVRPVPAFSSMLSVEATPSGPCGNLIFESDWPDDQPMEGSIDYTFTDLTTGDGFLYTATVPAGAISDKNQLFDVLQALTKGLHRFLLQSQFTSSNGGPSYQGQDKARFSCSFDTP